LEDAAMRQVTEADWKVFRRLRAIALERFCEDVLAEVKDIASDTRKSAHERYLAIFKAIQRRDEQIAIAFNDPRRSRAFLQLLNIDSLGVLTPEELSGFSPDYSRIPSLRDVISFPFVGCRRPCPNSDPA
jgi:hypothetical protein